MKRKFWTLFLPIVFVGTLVWSVSSDIWSLKGKASALRTTDVIRLTNSTTPDVELYNGDIYLKGAETQPTVATAGTYPGIKVRIKNCGGSSWVQGSLVTVNDGSEGCGMASPLTNDLTDWIGVAEGTVAAGSSGYVTVAGYALALTTQTVNRGDVLVSTQASAGYLTSDTTPTTGADVGVAMSSGNANGGLTLIRLR